MGMPYDLIWLCAPGYIILQFVALRRAPSSSRLLVALPLFLLAPLLVWTIFSLALGNNLWPLPLLFFCPMAFLYVAVSLLLIRPHPMESAS